MHIHRPYNIPISQIVLFQGRFLFYTIILTIPFLKVPISFALQAPHWNVFRVVEEVPKPQRKPHKGTPTTKGHCSICVNSSELVQCLQKPWICSVFSEMNFRHVANQSILPKNDVPTTLPPFFGWNSTNPHPSTQEENKKRLQAPPSTSPKASMQLSHCASSNKVSNRRTFTWTEKTAWTQSNDLDQIAYELCTEYFWIYWIYCMYVICECNTLW